MAGGIEFVPLVLPNVRARITTKSFNSEGFGRIFANGSPYDKTSELWSVWMEVMVEKI